MGTGTRYKGEALAMHGQYQEGVTQMCEGDVVDQSRGVRLYQTGMLYSLAQAYAIASQPDQGLITLDRALILVEQTAEHHYEAELHRVRGELALIQGDKAAAEASYRKAVEIALRQSGRSWELRATLSLARLWRQQGKAGQARESLASIYNWFTEGFDTPDLSEARALLKELSI